MFAHVMIRARDLRASEQFYRTVLAAIGVTPTQSSERLIGFDEFFIVGADSEHPPTSGLHIGFVAPTREHVDAFWRAGISAGYGDDGGPGERPLYGTGYYGAFLRDPDGNSVEAVEHDDTRRGGNIDHLWIGVEDLEAAAAFYTTIARHTGLRRGRVWEEGVQFGGAWATFSLVHDGRGRTDGLHMAFPAPDRQTVGEFHQAAIAAGYRDNGGPGERPRYGPEYYGAFVLDPDGTNVESMLRG
jgi:catechol 2,3-dioxygenase-like lactoylglutathione lyase family enzyme